MNNIPIWDTLSHPTINGNWLHPRYDGQSSIDVIVTQMRENNIKGAFAVGMKGIGQYDEDYYLNLIKEKGQSMFLPIAFLDFKDIDKKEIKRKLTEIKRKGYCGIKLHPRFAEFLITDERLPYIVDEANELDLLVLLCTFFYSNHQSMLSNNIERLGDLLMKIKPESDIVLLHGGLTRVLETMEMVRFFPNAVLDLSLTFCKYAGTHLDSDFEYIFKWFDRRTTIGTDSPEISYSQLRERFDMFASKTSIEKAENIAFRNIEAIMKRHCVI
jgi:predicted TIM-barrel fold metal-dependent hydrolase